VADLRRRVLMISGAVDTTDHDVSVCINLPEAGRWQVIKSETNLTDQTWVAMQVTTDEDSHFVNDEETLVLSRQFAKSFMTPDLPASRWRPPCGTWACTTSCCWTGPTGRAGGSSTGSTGWASGCCARRTSTTPASRATATANCSTSPACTGRYCPLWSVGRYAWRRRDTGRWYRSTSSRRTAGTSPCCTTCTGAPGAPPSGGYARMRTA